MVPEGGVCFIPSFGGLLLPGGPAYHVFQTSLRPELKNFIRQGMHLLNHGVLDLDDLPEADQTGLHGGGDLCLQLIRQDVYFFDFFKIIFVCDCIKRPPNFFYTNLV